MWLTRVLRHVQRSVTSRATPQTGRGRECLINAGKELEKSGILQCDVAHFGSLPGNRRLPGGDLLIKTPMGILFIPSRYLTAKGGIAIKKVGHAQRSVLT
jgi:hypothetical protein